MKTVFFFFQTLKILLRRQIIPFALGCLQKALRHWRLISAPGSFLESFPFSNVSPCVHAHRYTLIITLFAPFAPLLQQHFTFPSCFLSIRVMKERHFFGNNSTGKKNPFHGYSTVRCLNAIISLPETGNCYIALLRTTTLC